MNKDNVIWYENPALIKQGLLTELIRTVARDLIAAALQHEVQILLDQFGQFKTEDGRQAVERCGFQLQREILTEIGTVPVQVPKVRSNTNSPVSIRSSLVPTYARIEDEKSCVLVVIEVNEHGQKKFLAIEDGLRESKLC